MNAGRARACFAATIIALACGNAAFAGGTRRTFRVGAAVVASARLSSQVRASDGAIEVRASGHRAAPAALLVDGQVKPIADLPTILPAPTDGEVVVTILY
jgi:hypothetical protein